ncbi:amidohydrolase [Opitutia bacterium SCGC AG-212-L18]|nr:amidohydrolase [Opitutae bacterium SCGC AG-212-L18]
MMKKIFNDVIVLVGKELEPFLCSVLEIEDGFIKKIDKKKAVKANEGKRLLIMPGLWNSHTHIADSAFPDGAIGLTLEQGFFRPDGFKYRMLRDVDKKLLLESIVQHQIYMAQCGTVGHIDFREQGVLGSRLLKEASMKSGIRAISLGQFSEAPFSEKELYENVAILKDSTLLELQDLLDIADGFSESTINDLTDPAWIEIRKQTDLKNKIRAIHCLENENYRDTSFRISGIGDLERALKIFDPHLIVHMTVANDEEIELARKSKASFVLNPRANASLGLPLPPISKLLDSGINLLLGTDNGMLNSPNIFAELDFTYRTCKSQYRDVMQPDPVAILKMATSNISNFFDKKHYGYLEEGLPADFTVIDFSKPHLLNSKHIIASIVTRVTPNDVVETFVQGRPLLGRCEDKS